MKPGHVGWAVAALLLAAFFANRGQWQLERARAKEELVAAVARAQSRAPIEVDAGAAPGAARPVRIMARGQYDAAHEILLDNQAEAGRAGVRVLTPFRIAGTTRQLLVDRGWLLVDAATRRPASIDAPPAGEVELRGLLTALPGVGLRLGDGAVSFATPQPLLGFLDATALRAALGPDLVDGLLRLDADLPGGFLRNYEPVPTAMPPSRHRGYALQWFALAATVIVVWLLLAFRRK